VDCPVALSLGSKKSFLPSSARSGVSRLFGGDGISGGSSHLAKLGWPAWSTTVPPVASVTLAACGEAAASTGTTRHNIQQKMRITASLSGAVNAEVRILSLTIAPSYP